MRYGSVCSGIEAASVAWHGLGWRAAWVSEIEAFPSAVLAARWPGVENLGDMTALPERILARDVEAPDALVGGTPCQAFSVAGLRGSLSDARGNLTLTFVRIADAIDAVRRADGRAPAWIVWENVPGVLSVADNAFGAFLGGLVGGDAALEPPRGRGWTDAGVVSGPGRCAAWRILDAQHFGLAQRRRRVFVLARAGAGDWAAADALLPVAESLRWHPAPRRETGQRAAPCLAARTRNGGGLGTDAELDGALIPAVCPTLRAGGNSTGGDRPPGTDVDTADSLIVAHALRGDGGLGTDAELDGAPIPSTGDVSHCLNAGGMGRQDYETETLVAHTLRGEGFDAGEDGTGRGTPLVPVAVDHYNGALTGDVATTLSTGGAKMNGSGPSVMVPVAHAFDARQSDVLQYGDRTGPLDTDGHSVAVAMSMQVRRLTPRECERLQGFPDDYTAIPWRGKTASECPDGPRYKALGNSMAVPVMRWIGERIAAVDQAG